jgi:hypothetical protein
MLTAPAPRNDDPALITTTSPLKLRMPVWLSTAPPLLTKAQMPKLVSVPALLRSVPVLAKTGRFPTL